MNLEYIMLSEINQLQRDKQCMIPLTEYLDYSNLEMENRMVVSRWWEKQGDGPLSFNRHRISVLQAEESSRDRWQ